MKSNDIMTSREDLRQQLRTAVAEDNKDAFSQALNGLIDGIAEDMRTEMEQHAESLAQAADSGILAQRGVRQLTGTERAYYQKVLEAMRSSDPKQALSNIDLTFPQTVINAVFDELKTSHPLLSRINFIPAVTTRVLMDTSEYQEAQWGELCDEIVKQIAGGFEVVESALYKLSAIMFVCKPGMELGAEWLDRYVREILYECFANGMEAAIVAGDGKKKPIGMLRQVGAGVTVTDGVYPKKTAITVNSFDPATVGNLVSLLAIGRNGKPRDVRDLVLLVNPQDYFQKVMPATTLQAPDGTYRNDVLPYPMTVMTSVALSRGEAVLGIASRYFATAGIGTDGRIEYDDSYRFGEDKRTYIIKGYANGTPMDNNAFLYLDISGLQPAIWKVEQITPGTPSADATLSSLSLGAATLTPVFASATISYTASTTNDTNTITAVPSAAGAQIDITLNGAAVDNGSSLTWANGENTVKITVTAEDGTTTKAYTVTVTKS